MIDCNCERSKRIVSEEAGVARVVVVVRGDTKDGIVVNGAGGCVDMGDCKSCAVPSVRRCLSLIESEGPGCCIMWPF